MNNPLVSIIIPAYNAERFLADSIRSVLRQTYAPFEALIVDDGSTDGTAEIAKEFAQHITFFSQPNRGHAAARNYALSKARGKFIAFNDADDLWTNEDRLNKQADTLKADPSIDMVFGHSQTFQTPKEPRAPAPEQELPEKSQPAPISSTMLIRRKSFDQVGLFNENLRLGVFLDWYIRAREQGLREIVLPQVFLLRRIHADNASVRETAERSSYAKVLKAAIDRRRAAGGKPSV